MWVQLLTNFLLDPWVQIQIKCTELRGFAEAEAFRPAGSLYAKFDILIDKSGTQFESEVNWANVMQLYHLCWYICLQFERAMYGIYVVIQNWEQNKQPP